METCVNIFVPRQNENGSKVFDGARKNRRVFRIRMNASLIEILFFQTKLEQLLIVKTQKTIHQTRFLFFYHLFSILKCSDFDKLHEKTKFLTKRTECIDRTFSQMLHAMQAAVFSFTSVQASLYETKQTNIISKERKK